MAPLVNELDYAFWIIQLQTFSEVSVLQGASSGIPAITADDGSLFSGVIFPPGIAGKPPVVAAAPFGNKTFATF